MINTKRLHQPAAIPANEPERIAELKRYEILDTEPEVVFDRLTRMAAKRFHMPIALISLVDSNRQWFKSRYGLDVFQTPRDVAFCPHTILQDEVMVVRDTTDDQRFAQNPLVLDNPKIRFYAGAPLITGNGNRLGTMCVIDRKPHPEFSEDQRKELAELAAIVIDEMELRIAVKRIRSDLDNLKIAQVELDNARKKSEHILQEKTYFIANISHELRTPMNGILGMTYLLRDTNLDEVQREYINTISHSADNLLLLVNDVLDLSKIEAGELIIDRKPFDIRTAFTQSVKLLKPIADKKNIHLFAHLDHDLPSLIVSDKGRFTQILTNLIGNAVKFTDHGSVNAYLRYDKSAGHIYCEVKDTGMGIPKDKHNDIFEKFVQGNASITQKYGGTGLGLAITKQLVVMLGGEIGFESEVKVGSRFWFYIPAMQTCEPTLPEPVAENAPLYTHQIFARDARVLIAEDHPVNQLFLSKILKKFGFTSVDIAANGVEVMNKFYELSKMYTPAYDVIFMDCKMPEMDGYETTKLIRKEEQSNSPVSHIPIIAMTANALAGDRELCFFAGMDEYLTKPLHPEILKDILGRWFTFPETDSTVTPVNTAHVSVEPPIDFDRLALITETDKEKADLLALFFRLTNEAITTMERSRRDGEFSQFKNSAHSIKGSAANLGINQLATLCSHVEKGNYTTYTQRSEICESIKNEVQRVIAFINAKRPELIRGSL